MKKIIFSLSALFLISTFSVRIFAQAPTSAWINEFHYDDVGGDQDQFIEVVVNEGFSDLSNFTVSLYDGGKPGVAGTIYSFETLDNFAVGTTQDGLTFYTFEFPLQNGSGGVGDGIALDYNGTLISGQFLSYEGVITGTEGPANGITSTDIGIEESNRTPEGNSLYLIGSGTQYSDFFWSMGSATWGSPNTNQALPVELTSFSASINKNGIKLNWRTETEVNNYGFEIHRSTQKDNWENIGFVEGHGNSNSPKKYSFLDDNVSASGKYFYRLKQIDNDGTYEYSKVIEINFDTSQDYVLNQNYPNPFNPVTSISFQIPAKSNVTLKVYDIVGNEVATLVDEVKEAGVYIMRFDGSGLASGFYIFKLQANDFVEIRKMVLMK